MMQDLDHLLFGADSDRPQSLGDLQSMLPRRKRRQPAFTFTEETGTVQVDGDAVLRDMRAVAAELGIRPVPAPATFTITAYDLMPPGRQMLRRRGEVVMICDVDQWPEGVEFDEVVVHPDRYEDIKARMEKA